MHETMGIEFIRNALWELTKEESILKGKTTCDFIANQLRGFIYELAAIYTLASNGCCIHPFAFVERTIGKCDGKCTIGDFMVLCCHDDEFRNKLRGKLPMIVQVKKSPSVNEKRDIPSQICGSITRVLMYPVGEIREIEDLDKIEFRIVFPNGEEVSLKPRKVE